MSLSTLRSLFGYKSWADQQLFAMLAGLDAEHAELLHSCVRTLNHLYVVDRLFRARLSSEPLPFDATNTTLTPALAQLRSAVAETDAWYEDYAAQLGAQDGAEVIDFCFVDGDRGRMSREEILLHVISHGCYHRGNVGQLMKSAALTPPHDLYTRFLHEREPLRRES